MNYLTSKQQINPPNPLLMMAILSIATIFFLLDALSILRPIHNLSDYIHRPLAYWTVEFSRGINNTTDSIIGWVHLKDENLSLRREVTKLQGKLSSEERYKTENDVLRDQLKLKKRSLQIITESRLLVRDVDSKAGILTINRGAKDKVKLNDTVVYGDYFVGIIIKVNKYSSLVQTFYSGDLSMRAKTIKHGTFGLVTGSLNQLKFKDVLSTKKLVEGDLVILWDERLPLHLQVGKIKSIMKESGAPFQSSIVDPYIQYQDLDYLFVVRYD